MVRSKRIQYDADLMDLSLISSPEIGSDLNLSRLSDWCLDRLRAFRSLYSAMRSMWTRYRTALPKKANPVMKSTRPTVPSTHHISAISSENLR